MTPVQPQHKPLSPEAPPKVTGPWVESPFFEAEIAARNLPPEQERLARQFHENGFVVLEGAADRALTHRIVADVLAELERPDIAKRGNRVQDAWSFSPSVKEAAVLPRVLDVLRLLYGREPIPFQTLNFKFGTQQRAHADFVHFSCLPARYMCGAWVALEDVDADNGPLFYYPGSNRLPELGPNEMNETVASFEYGHYEEFQERLMAAKGLRPVEFHAKRGDILLWSSNIVHGGTPVRQPGRTRWSQVTHYYFENCIYYTPMESDVAVGELSLRENLVDIRTLQRIEPSYDGRPLRIRHLANGRCRVSFRGATSIRRTLESVARRAVRRLRGYRNRSRAAAHVSRM